MNKVSKEEIFKKAELKHGCGYWNVCDDHACPCSPTAAVSKGYDEKVYESMKRQSEECSYNY